MRPSPSDEFAVGERELLKPSRCTSFVYSKTPSAENLAHIRWRDISYPPICLTFGGAASRSDTFVWRPLVPRIRQLASELPAHEGNDLYLCIRNQNPVNEGINVKRLSSWTTQHIFCDAGLSSSSFSYRVVSPTILHSDAVEGRGDI